MGVDRGDRRDTNTLRHPATGHRVVPDYTQPNTPPHHHPGSLKLVEQIFGHLHKNLLRPAERCVQPKPYVSNVHSHHRGGLALFNTCYAHVRCVFDVNVGRHSSPELARRGAYCTDWNDDESIELCDGGGRVGWLFIGGKLLY